MKQGQDISAQFPGALIIHQKIRGNTVDLHRHEDHELFFPLQGEIHIKAGTLLLKAGPGKMVYLPPLLDHSFQAASTAQGERLILIVEDKTWRSAGGGVFSPLAATVSQLSKELLFHLLVYPKTKAARSLMETLIQTTSEMQENSGLQACGEVAHLEGQAADARVKAAISIIAKKFNLPLSVEDLARGAGLSTRNLNRLFLEELAMTPKQAITLFRVERAKQLLKRNRVSVTDTAFEVGYSSVSQFITTFRKVTGQLPSEFS